jgi:hypothetical protein
MGKAEISEGTLYIVALQKTYLLTARLIPNTPLS